MSRRTAMLSLFAVLLAVAGAAPAPAPAPAAPSKTVSQSERLRQRIDNLLKHRLKPEPLPVALANPFNSSGLGANGRHGDDDEADVPVVAGAKPVEEHKLTNAEALASCIPKLRISGMVKIKDQLHIVVNDVPRKEGDTIVLDRNNPMTYLLVVKIAPGALTLRLNDATQTVKF